MLSEVGNWEILCLNLGLEPAVISELIHSPIPESNKKVRCLMSYFNSGHASWEEVVETVSGPAIFNKKLASKIANKYLD